MLNLDAEGARRTAVDERWVEDYEVAVQDVVGHIPSAVPVALDVPVDQYRAGRRLVSLSNYHRSRDTEQEDGQHCKGRSHARHGTCLDLQDMNQWGCCNSE